MKRRSFLHWLGAAPLVPVVAKAELLVPVARRTWLVEVPAVVNPAVTAELGALMTQHLLKTASREGFARRFIQSTGR